MKFLTAVIVSFALSSFADNFNAGIGLGSGYALLAPKIGYEFNNGIGVDVSLSYFEPGLDYTAGIRYGVPVLDGDISFGPKVTVGHREFSNSRIRFEAAFVGLTFDYRQFFLKNNSFDMQYGVEWYKSQFTTKIGLQPIWGISYGYHFGRITPVIETRTGLSRGAFTALTVGQVAGGVFALAGALLIGAAVPGYPGYLGISNAIIAVGFGQFMLGTVSFLVCSTVKSKYGRSQDN